jgi:hypothetical protein
MAIVVHPLFTMSPAVVPVYSPPPSARLPLREIFGRVAEFCAAGELARVAILNSSIVNIIDLCDWEALTRHHFGISSFSVANGSVRPKEMFRHMRVFWSTIKRDMFGTAITDTITLPHSAARFFSGAPG